MNMITLCLNIIRVFNSEECSSEIAVFGIFGRRLTFLEINEKFIARWDNFVHSKNDGFRILRTWDRLNPITFFLGSWALRVQ